MKLRQLFKEQEQTPEVADVIVFWMEGNETKQHVLTNVPMEVIRASDFEEQLRRIVRRNFNQIMIRYRVTGDVTSQGNVDGETPGTETPPVLTNKDNEEVPPVEQRPDEIEAPDTENEPEDEPEDEVEIPTVTADEMQAEIDAAVDDAETQNIEVEVVPDSNDEPSSIEVTPEDETGPPPSINGVEIVSPEDLDRMIDDYADSVDQDGDGINDETGEPVTRSSDLPQVNVPKIGGGLDGDTGDEGVAGEEGAVTGEQRAEIPSIIEELRDAMSGPGTSETQMINALKRIGSPAHLEAVIEMYREEYGDSLPQDMIDEFKFDLGGNNAAQVAEISRVMRPLGWEITGNRYLDMRWQKYEGGGSTDSSLPSESFAPTDDEREQMSEAVYIYEQILNDARENDNWSQVEPIEYTNENGEIAFIRNPAERFSLPDKPYSEDGSESITAADLADIKDSIAELFPLISGARLPDRPQGEGQPTRLTIGTGQFAFTRELEDQE